MGKFVNNITEFNTFCKENEVEFIDFRFTDIKGAWHHITYKRSAVDDGMLEAGLPFDGSSIENWQPINQSDMLLKPDVPTAFLDPFTADSTVIVICDVYDIYKNELYAKCPRSIAKKALKVLEEKGVADAAYFGPENEFFIFDDVKIEDKDNHQSFRVETDEGHWADGTDYDEIGNMGHRPRIKGGYFPVMPTDSMVDLRAEMMLLLEEVGLEVVLGHHEVAQGQGEIGIVFSDIITAADNVQKYKYVVKMVAHLNGKTATFMPKPIYNDNGNGMHVHQSLWKNGKNLFYKEGEYANLSKTALDYLSGIFAHKEAVAAFTNASTNSYKRLLPGFEAPRILTYSSQNRSAACRIPYGAGEKATRIETRFPDSTSCPYLAFTVLMMAGLDGIEKGGYDLVGPFNEDLFELTRDELKERKIPELPNSFRDALEGLEKDYNFLAPVMDEEFIKTYVDYQFERHVIPVEGRPTAYEYVSTYSC
ncbi:MAG: type I glutamate--ammonia ligase [Sulfurovum sp.]|nr:type I glutamate--ammonia ligase [Sulfurovum sp.]MCB4745133.1 type I glutamate--ammonia ligase [Sulfurovum sp.]MCB4758025.1 type I glutamate--ammonia ligase [Sulfurovum sp.]MCB4761302.1 type I glutamate--ammonia ligase [Sulfurovum sp.]MCB4764742.1 type I glutamate--ammonia ligase [Sulfurovum sp.]